MNLYTRSTLQLHGIAYAFKTERGFLVQFLATVSFIIFIEIWIGQWWLIKQTILLGTGIIILELINTVIEDICDFIQPEYNTNIKNIKDLASGVVGVAISVSIIITSIDIITNL